ncbi:MAG: hypothetical protein WBK51_04340 [Polaromonas sp.]
MRTRILLLTVGIMLIAAFTVLNIDEFTRISTLSLGFTTMQLPLGLVMLMVLTVILLIFLATTIYMHSTQLMETRKYARELTAQRELADKAEASRFTELRRYLEAQATLTLTRDSDAVAVMDSRLAQTEKLLLHRMDQSDNSAAAYWGQHDDALLRNRPLSSV